MSSDLISRQAAVERFDYIRPRDPMTNNYTHGIDVGIALCKVAIREQPPAQLSTNLASLGTDCISRQQAIDALKEHRALYCDNTPDAFSKLSHAEKSRVDELDTAIATLVNLPPAEPKRGKWIEDKGQQTLMQNFIERGEVWRVCSVCGAGHMIGYKYAIDKAYHDRHHNFCPNCGADMRGEQDG